MNTPYTPSKGKISVLIITDRLLDRAVELSKSLTSAGVQVLSIAENKHQAISIAKEHSFHYLIIVGYLKNKINYDVINELKQQQIKFIPVQWALLDSLISRLCLQYEIPLKFERTLPIEDFVAFLDVHRDDEFPVYQEAKILPQPIKKRARVKPSLFQKIFHSSDM